ncbi:MAG: hypothetical protein KDK41_18060 [Leptospiraceae bacterium]|nr:hypothetical protein [Leptospiraceae bacterium]
MLATSILAPEKLAEVTDDILRRLEAIRKDVQRHFEPWEDREAEDLLRGAILIYLNKFPNIEHSIQAQVLRELPNFATHNFKWDWPEKPDTWFNHFDKVLAGQYPLNKIPEHLRDLAKELYY